MATPEGHPAFWNRTWVNVGLGTGLLGLVLPLVAHAFVRPDDFGATDLWRHLLLPHLVLIAVGALVGLGFALSTRQLERPLRQFEYVWWSGIFLFGVCAAFFGWVEKIIRRAGYDLSALDIVGNLWLLAIRIALWSLGGWLIGSYQWKRRTRPVASQQ